mmetsp:Transcript_14439/g.27741  ORF Transcript_14439/g.27741 Transcript_14439/m.27741 type:complete len:266 (-) Transcript_14439:304-1101(-)|eukprot:CAMPEP_0114253506 /NCGR_PEP_ID=MMETSP0058-20121206/16432_1 /TAXON_ID=36894 /ORGANISM="Pyramimonas parkeae, CCMP726" /LENGTH=265 /DNA_ID=CAMNT_0001367563 /DNA_START=35 /DNA_END=832 /DNA_ORIENTATION=+
MEQIQEVQAKIQKKIDTLVAEKGYKVEVAFATLGGAAQGVFFGGLFGAMMKNQPPPPPGVVAPPQPVAMVGGPLFLGRNVAIMTGVNAGLSLLMKRARGDKEDWQNGAVAAFVAGSMYSMVANCFPPAVLPAGTKVPVGAVAILTDSLRTGAVFAAFQSLFYTIGNKFSSSTAVEDTSFRATNEMLTALGLDKYQKNFKKGQLTDQCLTLLTESALAEVKVPPGPRLLILNHVKSIQEYHLKMYGKKGAPLSLALPVPGQPMPAQ